jgi:hypothetical protein
VDSQEHVSELEEATFYLFENVPTRGERRRREEGEGMGGEGREEGQGGRRSGEERRGSW